VQKVECVDESGIDFTEFYGTVLAGTKGDEKMRIRARSSIRVGFAAALVAIIGMGALSVAPAGATDPRTFLGTPDPVPLDGALRVGLDGYCDFDAEVTFTDFNQYIIHQTETTAPDGTITTTLDITGRARATVTNLSTGKMVSYNISGPGTIVFDSTGAFSIDTHGPNLLWTTRANSYPGVPSISYTTGHVTLQVDASGLTTSYSLSGRQTDVCRVLAS
jgi:hypothetical protein